MFKIYAFFQTLFIAFTLISGTMRADVLPIQSFKTSKGIEVWLVEDHTSPVVSIYLSFDKKNPSSPYSPISLLLRDGLKNGAGLLNPLEFQRFSNETPTKVGVATGISRNNLLLKTTKEGLLATLKLWSELVSDPQFEKANLNFLKQKTLTYLTQSKEDIDALNFLKLLETLFPTHTFAFDYAKAKKGIENTTAEMLNVEVKENFLTNKPKIVVVGDTDKKEITKILDSTFGSLKTKSASPKNLKPHWVSKDVLIKKKVPQSIVNFAQPGVAPNHKDYPKFILLLNVLSGRFFDELRTKRGYIYSISFDESHYNGVDILRGGFACECKLSKKVLKFIKSEWERLRDFGISQAELTSAKRGFRRGKVLSLTSTEAVAREYIDALDSKLDPEAAESLIADTEKVTLEEMNQFMQDTLKPEALISVLTGPAA